MWTEAQILNFTKTEIIPFVARAKQVVDYVVADKDIAKLADVIPHGDKVLDALGGVDKALGLAAKDLPYVGVAFAAYDLYRGLGGQAMEWGKPNDPEAEARLRERDALTGG